VPREKFTGDIPEYEYALYGGASQWKAEGAAKVVAALGEPLFQRGPKQYTSHRQSPFHHATEYAAVARSGRVGLFGFPLGASYFNSGYWVYRHALRHLLAGVYGKPLVETNAPLNTEVTVTHQAKAGGRNERWLVHVVNWSPSRGTPKHPTFHEEPVPLHDVTVTLNLPVKTARLAVAGTRVAVKAVGGGAQVVVPRLAVHEIVVFEA
jgi:hypothetical protein